RLVGNPSRGERVLGVERLHPRLALELLKQLDPAVRYGNVQQPAERVGGRGLPRGVERLRRHMMHGDVVLVGGHALWAERGHDLGTEFLEQLGDATSELQSPYDIVCR